MAINTKYPKHTIGQHIIPFQLTFSQDKSVQEAINLTQKRIGSWPNSENIYILDRDKKLLGEIEFKKLLTSKPTSVLGEIMDTSSDVLTDHSHQSTVIKIAIKKGVVSIPVVDREKEFLGIIDAVQILKIMHEEHVEKLMHF